MNRVARNSLLCIAFALVACILAGEILFFAWYCIIAFKLKITNTTYTVPAIMLFVLAVGWIPLLLHRYGRRAAAFELLVMTGAFAICDAVVSMLIVTDVRLLKLPAIMAISWIAGGLWGWAIVYLDKHRWRIGEKLGGILYGRGPMNDPRGNRPVITVIAISAIAVLVCIGIWVVGREKLLHEVWRESGYRKRSAISRQLIWGGLLINRPEQQVCGYFGQPEKRTDAAGGGDVKTLWWPIGTAPPGATSYNAGQKAYLCVTIVDGKAQSASIEYVDEAAKGSDEKENGNAH